jgi:hypothetical protein
MTDWKTSLSPETKAVLDAIDDVRWDWGNMCEASSDVIAVATLRAVVKELKYYGITEKNILRIADEMEGKLK